MAQANKDTLRYPNDVSDEDWAFVASYLTLITENAPQRVCPLRDETLAGLHFIAFAIIMAARFVQLVHFFNPHGCGCS
jgi:transposase